MGVNQWCEAEGDQKGVGVQDLGGSEKPSQVTNHSMESHGEGWLSSQLNRVVRQSGVELEWSMRVQDWCSVVWSVLLKYQSLNGASWESPQSS